MFNQLPIKTAQTIAPLVEFVADADDSDRMLQPWHARSLTAAAICDDVTRAARQAGEAHALATMKLIHSIPPIPPIHHVPNPTECRCCLRPSGLEAVD